MNAFLAFKNAFSKMQICKTIFSYLNEFNIRLFLILIYKKNIIS